MAGTVGGGAVVLLAAAAVAIMRARRRRTPARRPDSAANGKKTSGSSSRDSGVAANPMLVRTLAGDGKDASGDADGARASANTTSNAAARSGPVRMSSAPMRALGGDFGALPAAAFAGDSPSRSGKAAVDRLRVPNFATVSSGGDEPAVFEPRHAALRTSPGLQSAAAVAIAEAAFAGLKPTPDHLLKSDVSAAANDRREASARNLLALAGGFNAAAKVGVGSTSGHASSRRLSSSTTASPESDEDTATAAAAAAAVAGLPPGWAPIWSRSQATWYWRHDATGKTSWEKPSAA